MRPNGPCRHPRGRIVRAAAYACFSVPPTLALASRLHSVSSEWEEKQCSIAATVVSVKSPNRMAFRIETAARGRSTVVILSGRIENEALAELRKLFSSQTDVRDIVLDLKDVGVIDRDTMHFFINCELDGVKLENCPAYVREWMEREKD